MGSNLFGIGFGELVFIVILILIVFGPRRIPEVARTIGRFVQQMRQAASGVEDEMRQLLAGEGTPASWLEAGAANDEDGALRQGADAPESHPRPPAG